jgi:mono/diheme cytochrome c family protein
MKNVLFMAMALGAIAACRGQTSEDPPIVPIRNMYHQPKYEMQQEGAFFEDNRAMRTPVEGTISREMEIDPRLAHGRLDDDTGYVLTIPQEAVERHGGMDRMLTRGQERYGIYCTPCHGLDGLGQGMVVKHGLVPPPSYHQDRLRHMPDGQLYATIENGVRNMPAYGPQIPTYDRWAIVAYVRALQLSQQGVSGAAPTAPTPKPEEKKP